MVYAKIVNGTVVNILEIRQANAHEFPDCVPVNDIPAEIGDIYKDGNFYRAGEIIKSAVMRVAELEVQIIETEEATANEALAILSGEVAE